MKEEWGLGFKEKEQWRNKTNRKHQTGLAGTNHYVWLTYSSASEIQKWKKKDRGRTQHSTAESGRSTRWGRQRRQTQRDVVPIYFEGRNSDFFYNLANICKALGIKFNIAMLFLADELFKNQHNTFTVRIGKPISWQTFDASKTPSEWAQYVKAEVYKMKS